MKRYLAFMFCLIFAVSLGSCRGTTDQASESARGPSTSQGSNNTTNSGNSNSANSVGNVNADKSPENPAPGEAEVTEGDAVDPGPPATVDQLVFNVGGDSVIVARSDGDCMISKMDSASTVLIEPNKKIKIGTFGGKTLFATFEPGLSGQPDYVRFHTGTDDSTADTDFNKLRIGPSGTTAAVVSGNSLFAFTNPEEY
jgi:hypothetical protein